MDGAGPASGSRAPWGSAFQLVAGAVRQHAPSACHSDWTCRLSVSPGGGLFPGLRLGRSWRRKSAACSGWRCPGEAGTGRPGGPGPAAAAATAAVAGGPVRSVIVREAAVEAGSAGGAVPCGHLSSWGPERGSGLAGRGAVPWGVWGPGTSAAVQELGSAAGGQAGGARRGVHAGGRGSPPHCVLRLGKGGAGRSPSVAGVTGDVASVADKPAFPFLPWCFDLGRVI